MESKSILTDKIHHKKLKLIAVKNDISIKEMIDCFIDNLTDNAISLIKTSNSTKDDTKNLPDIF